ncbi:peptidase S41-like protein [Streptomyces sp. 2333.5]|uniref:S41 family peptidase n=1 Tax=unclassified Streptomyces TaxID=2593676 RepID=UPI00089B136A|nr:MULTISPECIES: S41 family peptidase [unclassified Streptomyces]PJJ06115.1 peptidase S41-like protein [Streptomyces sp. 2333.5]SEE90471.1 Peptidase family S41 [Streptomyces sp. 2314.4]SEF06960.1 Peptidase family S41 [Streptomyces sp. 2112.2]
MTTHAQIIDLALDRIVTGYVFPQRAVEVDQAIRARLASGAYDALSGAAFCAAVTAHLQEVCPDKHLRLLWQDEPRVTGSAQEDAGRAAFLALMRAENHGIRRCEQLDGNIGFLDVRWMADAGEGARAIGAAMELVAHTRALVLDLRECRGGSPAGAAMWCSYFFPDDQVHLNDFYERSTDSTRQYWTLSHLPAPRYLYRPVYVLTSATTFSGGEDVAYTLQAYERAEVIGETTRGGAHPTERYPVTEHITVTVPTARTTNAVTGTNWEGVGVQPDRDVPADTAFEVAYKEALGRTA